MKELLCLLWLIPLVLIIFGLYIWIRKINIIHSFNDGDIAFDKIASAYCQIECYKKLSNADYYLCVYNDGMKDYRLANTLKFVNSKPEEGKEVIYKFNSYWINKVEGLSITISNNSKEYLLKVWECTIL